MNSFSSLVIESLYLSYFLLWADLSLSFFSSLFNANIFWIRDCSCSLSFYIIWFLLLSSFFIDITLPAQFICLFYFASNAYPSLPSLYVLVPTPPCVAFTDDLFLSLVTLIVIPPSSSPSSSVLLQSLSTYKSSTCFSIYFLVKNSPMWSMSYYTFSVSKSIKLSPCIYISSSTLWRCVSTSLL